MSLDLKRGENIAEGIKRITREELESALEELEINGDRHEAIHEARKSFKRIRAIMRLVRDELGKDVYKRENVCYRDAGRKLSDLRDATSIIETVKDLREDFENPLDEKAFKNAIDDLKKKRKKLAEEVLEEKQVVDTVIKDLKSARIRIDDLPLPESNDFEVIAPGLRRVYKRGFKAFHKSYEEPTTENFHDWRKRVKYLWHQTEILENSWQEVLKPLGDEIHELANYLGDDHDLMVLKEKVEAGKISFHDKASAKLLLALCDKKSEALRTNAKPLAAKIYHQKPDEFVSEIESYWNAWKKVYSPGSITS